MGDNIINLLPLPALLLELGFVLLAIALLWYARVLGGLLELQRKPPLEVLVVIAAWVLIIAVVLPDFLANALFYPNAQANADMLHFFFVSRTISFFGLLVASVLVIYPTYSYYRWAR